jgi:DNA-binding transcriptional regulator YbjK
MKADGRLSRGTTRKTLLLDAAVRIVAEFGANAHTHRAVAKSAEVSLASVTYHFPSSELLRSATYEYAGSRIGQELLRLVFETSSNLEALPDICADFTARLVTDHRIDTMTVFEMIMAAGHDPQLSPVTRLLNERLAKVLKALPGIQRGCAYSQCGNAGWYSPLSRSIGQIAGSGSAAA